MALNRLSGLFVACLGMILFFWIIPWQTETVELGWLKPATLPNIMAVLTMLLGLFHFVFPTGTATFDVKHSLRLFLFWGICLITIYFIGLIGYLIAGPVMVAVIIYLIGERRPLWLLSTIILSPLVIWFSVVILLNRPLP